MEQTVYLDLFFFDKFQHGLFGTVFKCKVAVTPFVGETFNIGFGVWRSLCVHYTDVFVWGLARIDN